MKQPGSSFLALLLLTAGISATAQKLDLSSLPSPILFRGDRVTAYRDPTAVYYQGTFHLFFTLVETEPDGTYWYTAISKSHDLQHWTPPRRLTPRDRNKNFSRPGGVIRFRNEWILCLQSYPTPKGEVFGNSSSRLWIMRSKDLETWSEPEILLVKGPYVHVEDMGRTTVPYLFRDRNDPGKWWCFYKQNGVSMSWSRDLKTWTYEGRTEAGENGCVLVDRGQYVLFHSPDNGIGIMRSGDLKNWSDVDLLTLGQKDWSWAAGRLSGGFVLDLRHNPRFRRALLFFQGDSLEGQRMHLAHGHASIGIAWSADLHAWHWPGEPSPSGKAQIRYSESSNIPEAQ